VTEILRDVALLVGLGSSSVGMTGIVSTDDRTVRALGMATIAAGLATLVASRLDIIAG
jgi:hypothetical protein